MYNVKKIDFFDGEWTKIDVDKIASWFSCKVDWDNVEDVREHGTDHVEVNFKNRDTLYYKDIHGHYSQPVRFR